MSQFIISLDFELYWGVRAKKTIAAYRENLLGARKVIPPLLDLFGRYNIKATFATVGFLFCKNQKEWMQHFPELKPTYDDPDQNPYSDKAVNDVANDVEGVYHFAPGLIRDIKVHGHEIGTHTFCHYYCKEPGQTPAQFRADIQAAKKIAAAFDGHINSIVFPRNQFSHEHLRICREESITTYRGNQHAFYYAPMSDHEDNMLNRALRLADTYLNISGHNCYDTKDMREDGLINIPASMFLRPCSRTLRMFESLRLRRIKNSMTFAAKNNLAYHIWWHPHNFGKNITENIAFLESILQHYQQLSRNYSFESITMEDLSSQLIRQPSSSASPVFI